MHGDDIRRAPAVAHGVYPSDPRGLWSRNEGYRAGPKAFRFRPGEDRESRRLSRGADGRPPVARWVMASIRSPQVRHVKATGLLHRSSPHPFWVATVTDLPGQNVPLEDVQYLTHHADAWTNRICSRQPRKTTRNAADRDEGAIFNVPIASTPSWHVLPVRGVFDTRLPLRPCPDPPPSARAGSVPFSTGCRTG